MKLVQTLLVRDEVDIVDAQIAYHLNAGVDFVIATDNDSRDGTTDILESYARDGHLRRIFERDEMRESTWRTRMARLAEAEHHADWVIHTDADEFWVPHSATLREVFDAVPSTFGIVWALSRHFPPRPGDGDGFAERMIVRVSLVAPLNDPTSPYRPHAKVAHRAVPDVIVRHGGHSAVSPRLRPLTAWPVAEVFHYPYRTLAQYEHKSVRGARMSTYTPLGQYVRASQARDAGRVEEGYAGLVVDDETLSRGTAAGALVVDTRLRDALRALGSEPVRGSPAPSPDPGVVAESAALREADVVRLHRHVDELRRRARAL